MLGGFGRSTNPGYASSRGRRAEDGDICEAGATLSSGNAAGAASRARGLAGAPPDPVRLRMNWPGVRRSVFLLKEKALTLTSRAAAIDVSLLGRSPSASSRRLA